MLKFHPEIFIELLHTVPEAIPYYEKPEHSDYLQTEVFDKLSNGEAIDLTMLDLDAFELCHVTPDWYEQHFESMAKSWQRALNRMLKLTHATAREQRAFF